MASNGLKTQISKIQIDDKCSLHYQISDLLSFSHPTDPVISQSGIPSLSASTWPVPPPPSKHHVLGMPDPSCPWQRGGQRKKKNEGSVCMPYTIQPMVHLSHALHFCHCQLFFTVSSLCSFTRCVKIRKLFVFLDSFHPVKFQATKKTRNFPLSYFWCQFTSNVMTLHR